MIKKLSKHGDVLALVIDPSILESLGIDEHTPLELSTAGRTLIVSASRSESERQQFEQAVASVNERYSKTFKRLAE